MHVYSTLIAGLIAGSTSAGKPAKLCEKKTKKVQCKKDDMCKWSKGTCVFEVEKALRHIFKAEKRSSDTDVLDDGAASVTESPTEPPTELLCMYKDDYLVYNDGVYTFTSTGEQHTTQKYACTEVRNWTCEDYKVVYEDENKNCCVYYEDEEPEYWVVYKNECTCVRLRDKPSHCA